MMLIILKACIAAVIGVVSTEHGSPLALEPDAGSTTGEDGMEDRIPRTALVTGAGKRVSRALALALARDGYDVAVHCHRSRAEAEEVTDLVRSAGRRAVVLVADRAREIEAAALVPAAA